MPNKPIKRGLTVGKFAPLHKGHDFMIKKALDEVDELVIIVYDAPEHTEIPLTVRAEWLRKLYPDVLVIEGWGVPKDEGWTEEIQKKHEDYILSKVKGMNFYAFYSSEAYGFRMSKALECFNRSIDPDRSTIGISGTQIRSNVYEYRDYLEPIVYASFITKIGILGANESNRRQLAKKMATHYDTAYASLENPSEDPLDNARNIEQLTHHQIHDARGYLFIDSPALQWQVRYRNAHFHNHPEIEALICETRDAYDLLFVLPSVTEEEAVFHQQLISELKIRKMHYIQLSGNLESQMSLIATIILNHHKY